MKFANRNRYYIGGDNEINLPIGTKYEFIDSAYDWCIKNKSIGFEIDW